MTKYLKKLEIIDLSQNPIEIIDDLVELGSLKNL
jgi:Leucine-rich repeat (LRR) protein